MSGQAPDEEALQKQTADNLVATELLPQEAESRGIEVSDEAVDAELTGLAEQNQLGRPTSCSRRSRSRASARTRRASRSRRSRWSSSSSRTRTARSSRPRRSCARSTRRPSSSAGQSGQKIPAFAQVRDQLAEQATSQKIGKVAGTLAEDLRKDADITINL